MPELLQGRYQLAPPRRASDAEVAALDPKLGQRLRDLLWLATHQLGEVEQGGVDLSGQYRLLRWPDARALARPGLPKLAALLTSRPQTIAQASAASGASVAMVSWFLRTNLALGTAESVELENSVESPQHSPAPGSATPAPSMLSRIRDRLKLW